MNLSSQYEALKKVNKELINLYWNIMKMRNSNHWLEKYLGQKMRDLVLVIQYKNAIIIKQYKEL